MFPSSHIPSPSSILFTIGQVQWPWLLKEHISTGICRIWWRQVYVSWSLVCPDGTGDGDRALLPSVWYHSRQRCPSAGKTTIYSLVSIQHRKEAPYDSWLMISGYSGLIPTCMIIRYRRSCGALVATWNNYRNHSKPGYRAVWYRATWSQWYFLNAWMLFVVTFPCQRWPPIETLLLSIFRMWCISSEFNSLKPNATLTSGHESDVLSDRSYCLVCFWQHNFSSNT